MTESVDCEAIAQSIINKAKIDTEIPRIGLVTGTGLSGIADLIEERVEVSYSDIPGFPRTQVQGHPGRLVFGKISGKNITCLQGRVHYYEGYSFHYIGNLVRILHHLGIKLLILSNAAGGLNRDFAPGDVMIIKDHINLMADNALKGVRDAKTGGYPFINLYYDQALIRLAHDTASEDKEFAKKIRVRVSHKKQADK